MRKGLTGLAVLAMFGLVVSPLPAAAQAPKALGKVGDTMCGPTDRALINEGKYVVFNGIWNAEGNGTADQCIEVTEKGFISRKMDVKTLTGAPLSYPSVTLGCSPTSCSPGSQFPLKTSDPLFKKLHTQTKAQTPDAGEWNAAYDLFFRADSTPGFDGSVLEFMVWYNTRFENGRNAHPIGKMVDTVDIAGDTWDVWYGPNKGTPGQNTVSYVRHLKSDSLDFMVEDLYADAVKRNFASRDWYLNWINTGFEVWTGALGLNIVDFSMDYNGRPATDGPEPQPVPSSPAAAGAVPGGPRCEVSTDVIARWKGGYLVKVAVTNHRKTATTRWRAWLPMTPGQDVGGSAATSNPVFAKDVFRADNGAYNGSLEPEQTATFFAAFFQDGSDIPFSAKPGCFLG